MKRTLVLVIALLSSSLAASHAAETRLPNVVLLLIGDRDKMKSALKFSRAYVTSAVCTPPRYVWVRHPRYGPPFRFGGRPGYSFTPAARTQRKLIWPYTVSPIGGNG